MIAMALALDPDILIADEPTTALDVTTQAQILDLIRKIQKRKGMSVMFITHDFGVVAEIADRVVVMEKGKLVEKGPAERCWSIPPIPIRSDWWRPFRACAPAQARSARMRTVVLEVEKLEKEYRLSGSFFGKTRVVKGWTASASSSARARRSACGRKRLGQVLARARASETLGAGRRLDPLQVKNIAGLSEERSGRCGPISQMIFQDPFASLNRATRSEDPDRRPGGAWPVRERGGAKAFRLSSSWAGRAGL